MLGGSRPLLATASLVLACASSLANADGLPVDSSGPFLVRSWQTENGLPDNMVLAIAQTRDGYLWLGTGQGLVRFDGVSCRLFGLQDGLHGLEISALLEDSRGVLWIGTVGGGLSSYSHGTIKTFTTADGLNGEAVNALLEDTSGGIWIGTTAGLYRWKDGRFSPMAQELGSIYVHALAKDQQGAVWVSTLHNGLLCFKNGKFTTVTGPPGARTIGAYCLLVDNKGRLWAGSQNGVVLCRENGKWTKYNSEDGLPGVYINALAETADGTIWCGTLDEGLYYLKDGKFGALKMQDGLSDDAICWLYVDRQENLWVGTRSGGLDRLSQRKLFVCHIVENSSERLPISLAQTTNGDIWVGAAGRGIYYWSHGQLEQLLRTNPAAGHLFVGALLAARDGSLWWGAGPALFQWKDGAWLSVYDQEPWLRGDRVLSLCEDRDGGMWVGTYNGQLQLLKDGRFLPVHGMPGRKPVVALAQDPDGSLWIGSMGGGLLRLQNGRLSIFTVTNGLRSDLIRVLHLDHSGTLWIGTDGGGLARWAGGRITSFTSRQGLMDDTVLQILEDDAGNLWLGSNRGICRVSKRSLDDLAAGKSTFVHPLVFGNSDGMVSEQCEWYFGSGLRTSTGQLLFCTAKGIVVIDPWQQTNTAVPPSVLIEDVLVDGQSRKDLFSTWNEAADAKSPVIPAGRHTFEFHYTGLNFRAPEKIQFRYRLAGLDSGWVEAGAMRVARYPYLPPGRYDFEVTACNSDGRWNKNAVTTAFVVLPHFWETPWFLALLFLTFLGAAGGGIRYIERRRFYARLKRLELERVTECERARIARDLHDELGASLARISMLSDLSQSRDNSLEQLKTRVEKISNFSIRTARSLDEIVWAVNPRNDSLRSLLEYLTQFARELFEDTNVRCRFYLPENLPRSLLLPEMRHNIFLTVKEALTNALKHAGATEISLRAQVVGTRIEIIVQDNGAGLDPSLLGAATARSGLGNMRQRIESLGGQFSVQATAGHGTALIISLQYPVESSEPPKN
ncbi:MAG TPA: two-component regulator propeller domain-containing protein [Candidatus Sulfotelmatobacter sp.]|nr:two-component regulator propeller domain-containing protein [Candidatus Sulfotelmatobacter sp.]